MSVEDPYAPKPPAVVAAPVFPLARLRRLGAPADQLQAMGGVWDGWSLEQRRAFVEELSVLTDAELSERLHGRPS